MLPAETPCLLGQCSRPRLLILLSKTITGSLFIECHWYKPAYFFLFWPRISYSFQWNRNRFSFHLLKNGTVRSVCLSVVPSGGLTCSLLNRWIWLRLPACSANASGQDSLLAQPIFRPRLLACSANLPAKTPCLIWLTWVAQSMVLLLFPAAIIMTIAPRLIGPW